MSKYRYVMIVVPAYKGEVSLETMHTLLKMRDNILSRGWDCCIKDLHGSGLIHNIRNRFVAEALASTATDLIFLDDDVGVNIEDADGAVLQLLDAPVDLVAGVYSTRIEPIEYKVQYCQDRDELWADPATGLLEVEGVPAGFLRLSRDCMLRMVHYYAGLEYDDTTVPGGKAWGLFYPMLIDRRDWGEDLVFCKRWREIGGKVWVVPLLRMQHVGRKTYEGCFGEWLLSRAQEGKLEAAE